MLCNLLTKYSKILQQGDPIEERFKEFTERGAVIDQLNYCIASYREAAMSADAKFDHIDLAEKQKVCILYVCTQLRSPVMDFSPNVFRSQVLTECVEAEAWLREKKQQQDSLPKHTNPVLLSADIKKKAEALDRYCEIIRLSLNCIFLFQESLVHRISLKFSYKRSYILSQGLSTNNDKAKAEASQTSYPRAGVTSSISRQRASISRS